MGRGLAWTTDQFATLVRMRASGADYREIAAAVGRSVESCKNKLTHPSRHPDGAADLELAELRRVSNIDCQLWSTDAEAELIRLREVDGLSWYLLDSHFGRGHGSCRHKYRELAKIGRPKADKPELPPSPIITPRWTDADMTLAQTRWRELFADANGARPSRYEVCRIIGVDLQRTPTAVASRLRSHGASFGLYAASKLWSTDAEAELIRLREVDGLSWYLLDSHFGRGHGSCRHKYRELAKIGRPKADKPELPPSPIITPRWTDADMTLAQTRWRELFVDVYGVSAPRHERFLIFEQIGRELQRSGPAVENRLRIHGASFGLSAASKPLALPVEISQAMVEREARKRAEAHRSITASFFGDPPPGYSALDQRRQQCTGAPRDI